MVEHIVIIGGGIMGVCTAYYISQDERFQRGTISLTIVEANEIAGGASGKAAGFLALDWHGTATSSLAKLSYELHQELATALDGRNVYGYRQLTSLNCRARVSHDSHEPLPHLILAQLESNGEFRPKPPSKGTVQTGWLSGSAVEDVDLISGEDTTAQVHPELFTNTLFEAVSARGVQHIKGRPRTWNRKSDGKFMTIDTPSGRQDIRADLVLLTAGPWTGRVAKELLDIDISLSYLPGHSILIRPTEPLPPHAVFASVFGAPDLTESPEMVVRPDGLVYVAGQNTGAELPEGTDDVKLDAEAIQKLVQTSGVLSNSLKGGTVEAEQLCYRPMTRHGDPLIGVIGNDNDVFVAAGHGPWGITLGPGTGKVMAELILDGIAKSADISQLDPSHHIKFRSTIT